MKRAGSLFPEIASWANLARAADQARRGKRRRRNTAEFEHDREARLLGLRRGLLDGSWQPGRYRTFQVKRPVPRLISAAPYADRVVHHALMNVLGPVLERGMIFDSYANRAGKGTHAALDRFTHFARRNRYLLHGDIRLYFPSIDHEILKRLLERRVKCGPTLELAARIIDGSNPQVDAVAYFPGDDLFTPHERRRGLPIGNLTSQWLANFYLDGLDHFVQERLRPRGYLRYVDDFVLFADDKRSLHAARDSISRHLEGLRLRLHETKTFVAPARAGCRFLGFVVTPWVRKLRAENVRAFRRRLRAAGWRPGDAMEPDGELGRSVSAWVAHAAHGSTWRLRRRLLGALADGPAAAAS